MIREDCESWLHKHHYELWLEWDVYASERDQHVEEEE